MYDNFKCPYEKSLETYRMHLVYIYIYIYIWVGVLILIKRLQINQISTLNNLNVFEIDKTVYHILSEYSKLEKGRTRQGTTGWERGFTWNFARG